jgi:hypothetical protein
VRKQGFYEKLAEGCLRVREPWDADNDRIYGFISGKPAKVFEVELPERTHEIHTVSLQGKSEGDCRIIWEK